jgi:hypothetical protein
MLMILCFFVASLFEKQRAQNFSIILSSSHLLNCFDMRLMVFNMRLMSS